MTWLTIACLYIALLYALAWLCRAIWVSLSRLVWGMLFASANAIPKLCITRCRHMGRARPCQHAANHSALYVDDCYRIGSAVAETVLQRSHGPVWAARHDSTIHVCVCVQCVFVPQVCMCLAECARCGTAQGRIAISHHVGHHHAKVCCIRAAPVAYAL